MQHPVRLLVAAVAACGPPALAAQGGPPALAAQGGPVVDEDVGRRLSEVWTAVAEPAARVAAVVAVDGEVLFETATGSADFDGAPITGEHLFDLGSLSKHVTAAAVLRLVDRGELELATTLGDVFDGVPADKSAITVAQLLGHTSGFPVVANSPLGDLSRGEAVAAMLATPLATAPGERAADSNVGYQLAAAVVEETAGRPFERFVERELFDRARLDRATLVGAGTPSRDVRTVRSDGGRRSAIHEFPSGWGRKGATGVLMSTADFVRWDAALRAGRVLSTGARDRWAAPGAGGFGLGWLASAEAGGPRLEHGGSVEGYRGWAVRWPASGALVVVLGDAAVDAERLGLALESALFERGAPTYFNVVLGDFRAVRGEPTLTSAYGWRFHTELTATGQVYGFLPFNREGPGPRVTADLHVDRDLAFEWLSAIQTARRDVAEGGYHHRVRVTHPADGGDAEALWTRSVRGLQPFAEPGAQPTHAVIGLRHPDGTWGLAIELDHASLGEFVASLGQALDGGGR